MPDRVFLTDARRDVLNGNYDGSDDALRNQKSRLRRSARTALQELIAVADSGEIDNTEVFDPADIYALLQVLTVGRDTFETSDPDDPHYREVPTEYRNEILTQIDRLRLEIHGNERWNENQ